MPPHALAVPTPRLRAACTLPDPPRRRRRAAARSSGADAAPPRCLACPDAAAASPRAPARCRRRASALPARCLTRPDAAAVLPRAPAVPTPRLRAAWPAQTPPPRRRALQRCQRRASALHARCLTRPDAAAVPPRAPAVPTPRLRAACTLPDLPRRRRRAAARSSSADAAPQRCLHAA
eukprot:scaffold2980_cov62-Phaeocystis_antarctica.AAC.2